MRITAKKFQLSFLTLMFFALTAPALFGLIFLYVIDIFSVDQIIAVLVAPPIPVFAVLVTAIALFYFM